MEKTVGIQTVIMETDCLILAQIRANDVDFMADFLSDPMLTRYLPKGGPYTGPEIEEYVAARLDHWETHGFGIFVLRKKTTGRVVGYLRKIGMVPDPVFDCYGDVVSPFSITLDQFRDKPLLHTKGA